MNSADQPGQIPGLKGPSLLERALFPLRLVFRPGYKNIPYNCLNPRVVRELLALRRSWTVMASRQKGVLKDNELTTMLNVYGSAWFKEFWLLFGLLLVGMLVIMGVSTVAFGITGAVVSSLLTYAGYVWVVGSTMNVIRPGELEKLLPYLRLDGADRAYLEATGTLANATLEHSQRVEILSILNRLLEQDYALQQQLGVASSTSYLESQSDLASLQSKVAETAGTALGEVYAETLRYAQERSKSAEQAETKEELIHATRALILQKLWSIRTSLSHPGDSRSAELSASLALDAVNFDSHSLVRALNEVQSLQGE